MAVTRRDAAGGLAGAVVGAADAADAAAYAAFAPDDLPTPTPSHEAYCFAQCSCRRFLAPLQSA